jgi:predicted 2-oxoglutarate/Fe(II)-dependent dioxygenase YbiX
MFGSLVVILPTDFKGGELILRHDEKEFKYDHSTETSSLNCDEDSAVVSWIAFFSDVEHEVLPVTEGYRVTLTYVCPFLLLSESLKLNKLGCLEPISLRTTYRV